MRYDGKKYWHQSEGDCHQYQKHCHAVARLLEIIFLPPRRTCKLSMCVLKLCTFLSRPLQNSNVKSPKFARSEKGNTTTNYLSFHWFGTQRTCKVSCRPAPLMLSWSRLFSRHRKTLPAFEEKMKFFLTFFFKLAN